MKSEGVILKFIIVATVTLCLILLGSKGAFTQEDKPCAGDVEKFCQGVQQGGGRISQCLVQHKEELSLGCKLRIAEVIEQLKEVKQACGDDVMWFCAGVKPGGGQVAMCLMANEAQLSPECLAALSKGN
jgi:hypothetical protein